MLQVGDVDVESLCCAGGGSCELRSADCWSDMLAMLSHVSRRRSPQASSSSANSSSSRVEVNPVDSRRSFVLAELVRLGRLGSLVVARDHCPVPFDGP